MASVALCAEAFLMFVVFLVAAVAGIGGDEFPPHRLAMTIVTTEPFVSVIQFEPSSNVMVKIPQFPVSCGMARITLCAELLFVHIFLFVTANAL